MTASVTRGRALRYAGGSARGLLHHVLGHCPGAHFAYHWNGAAVDFVKQLDSGEVWEVT